MSIKDYQHASQHLHQMMIAAHTYKDLDATHLRELLSHGICTSFIAAIESKNKYPALPTQQNVFTKADIQSAHPDISAATITRVLNELRKNDMIEMIGLGRNTQWRKK